MTKADQTNAVAESNIKKKAAETLVVGLLSVALSIGSAGAVPAVLGAAAGTVRLVGILGSVCAFYSTYSGYQQIQADRDASDSLEQALEACNMIWLDGHRRQILGDDRIVGPHAKLREFSEALFAMLKVDGRHLLSSEAL